MPNPPWTEQRDELLDDVYASFGELVTLHREGSLPITMVGAFEEAHIEADTGMRQGVTEVMTTVELALKDVPLGEIFETDQVSVSGRRWRILVPEYDGEGAVVLQLSEIAQEVEVEPGVLGLGGGA